MNHTIVIGIGGISGGGKTSVCERLSQQIKNSIVLHMDDYFWQYDEPGSQKLKFLSQYNNKFVNWDALSAVNFDRLQADIEAHVGSLGVYSLPTDIASLLVVFVEGTMVLSYRPIQRQFMRRYFFTLPRNVAFERRRQRLMFNDEPDDYFDSYVWPSYEACRSNLTDEFQAELVDGQLDVDNTVLRIYEDIKQSVSTLKNYKQLT